MALRADIEAECERTLNIESRKKGKTLGWWQNIEYVKDGAGAITGYYVEIGNMSGFGFAFDLRTGAPDLDDVVEQFGAEVIRDIRRRRRARREARESETELQTATETETEKTRR